MNNQKLNELAYLDEGLENYFRNTIIPHLLFDKDLILCRFTPAAMNQFNLSHEDLGRPIQSLLNNFRFPSIVENINWVTSFGKILEKEIQTTDLSWYKMNIIPYFQKKDNKQNGVIITFLDITNRIRDVKEQENIISEYDTLLKTISHDIKNRLGSMLLSIDMLKLSEVESKDEKDYYLNTLEDGVRKINLLLGELVESTNQNSSIKVVDELLNIEHILEDVKYALINEISQTNTTLVYNVETPEIFFSRRDLRRILYNLVSNSIKFSDPNRSPEILIKSTHENNYIVISVKDNGIGIDPTKHEEIFSKYFQIEKSAGGSGMGLPLVKSLVKNASGRIEIQSQLGVGTEFKIYLKAKSE